MLDPATLAVLTRGFAAREAIDTLLQDTVTPNLMEKVTAAISNGRDVGDIPMVCTVADLSDARFLSLYDVSSRQGGLYSPKFSIVVAQLEQAKQLIELTRIVEVQTVDVLAKQIPAWYRESMKLATDPVAAVDTVLAATTEVSLDGGLLTVCSRVEWRKLRPL